MNKVVLGIIITLVAAIIIIISVNLRTTQVNTLQETINQETINQETINTEELSSSETSSSQASTSRINIGGTAISEITENESTQTASVNTRAIADINAREINFVQNTASGKLVTLKDGSELFVGSGAVEQLPPEVVFQADYVFEPSEYDE